LNFSHCHSNNAPKKKATHTVISTKHEMHHLSVIHLAKDCFSGHVFYFKSQRSRKQ
jgi:hypothetical protein